MPTAAAATAGVYEHEDRVQEPLTYGFEQEAAAPITDDPMPTAAAATTGVYELEDRVQEPLTYGFERPPSHHTHRVL